MILVLRRPCQAHNLLPISYTDSTSRGSCIRAQATAQLESLDNTACHSRLLLWRRSRLRRGFPRRAQPGRHTCLSSRLCMSQQRLRHQHADTRAIPRRRHRESRHRLRHPHDPSRRQRRASHARRHDRGAAASAGKPHQRRR